jgi:hypothetical protein
VTFRQLRCAISTTCTEICLAHVFGLMTVACICDYPTLSSEDNRTCNHKLKELHTVAHSPTVTHVHRAAKHGDGQPAQAKWSQVPALNPALEARSTPMDSVVSAATVVECPHKPRTNHNTGGCHAHKRLMQHVNRRACGCRSTQYTLCTPYWSREVPEESEILPGLIFGPSVPPCYPEADKNRLPKARWPLGIVFGSASG